MPSPSSSSSHPALLPPGTQIGSWRVVDWAGQGVHGAVYRAVRIGQEHLPPVALKLALLPENPRFARERELLSRSLHPHIPRLVDHGSWQSPGGSLHPFLAMEWIDGVPLYDWARLFQPSAAQQLRLLAQVALTLQYLHAQGAFHRDLKGGNLLVRRSDSRLFLTDFGSGIYPGAETLTPQQLPPGTPAYRSPEAWLFNLQFRRSSERYHAGPADDVFALGVTACVLATGSYPELGPPRKDEQGTWHLDSLVLPQALFSARVAPPLRELILRMLSLRPEQRGTPAQLTQALEQAADSLSPPRLASTASVPERPAASSTEAPSPTASLPAHLHVQRRRLALAAAAGALATVAVWLTAGTFTWGPAGIRLPWVSETQAGRARAPDEGPVGLGEAAASTAPTDPPKPSASEAMAADSAPEPLPGQTLPDKKGRCPHKQQVILNGGCWRRIEVNGEECETFSGHMYKGACYVPILTSRSGRPSTSSPGNPQ
jgi:eukaryotic-like serine/threonine-protein kinase